MPATIYFDEILLDPNLFNLGAVEGSPEFANSNSRSPETGIAKVAVKRLDPQLTLACNFSDISHPDPKGLEYLNDMWYGGLGSAYGFRVRWQVDYYAIGEVLAVGNNTIRDFKLTKTYSRPGTSNAHDYIRRIIKPVVNTQLKGGCPTLKEPDGGTNRVIEIPFIVYLNGTPTAAYTIDNTTGDLQLTSNLGTGVELKVDYQFDIPCQFWMNSFTQRGDFPAEARGFILLEVMPATLGII